MSSVYIIGNGFDLNLGLKTSYRDFVCSDFFMSNVDVGNGLFDYLYKVHQGSNWIDIEKELENYSMNNNGYREFLNDYKKLCETLKKYIKSIDISSMDVNSEAYKIFSSNDLGEGFRIINFNYTDSVFYILKSIGYSDNVSENIVHIHGSAAIDEIIFGVDDKAGINDEHTFLYKSTSSIYDGNSCIDALEEFENLHVFGHSLGESDHMYLQFFFPLSLHRSREGSKGINIYHYSEEAKYDIYKQLHKLTHNGVSGLKNNTKFKDIDLIK